MVRQVLTAAALAALIAAGAASAALLATPVPLTTTAAPCSGSSTTTTPAAASGTLATVPSTSPSTRSTATTAATGPAALTTTPPPGTEPAILGTTAPGATTSLASPAPATSTQAGSTMTAVAGDGGGGCGVPASTSTATGTGEETPPPAEDADMLVLSGHGWGHGVGLSQWGAYGYALHGWSAAQILQHFYPRTTLGTNTPVDVRVLVSGPDVRVRLGSSAPWRLVDGAGTALSFPAGTTVVPAALLVGRHRLVSPLRLRSSQPLTVGGRAYRGTLLVVSNGERLDVVDVLGMETYLDGVVGAEMPASWPAAALEAQAIAARSYALSEIEDVVTAGPFELFGDSRSQAYGGVAAESPAATQAVAATAHEVVLYKGQVARTYYSASSGGETVSAAEAFGTPFPYLVPVADPYDTLSPYHDWGPVEIPASTAGEELGLPGPLEVLRPSIGASRHVTSATAVAAAGQLTLSGTQVAADLGLRSSWFSVGWLDLDPPAAPVPLGTAVTLSGRASGLGRVELEDRAAGTGWQLLAAILPARSGAFSVTVTPTESTRYRLVAGGADGAVVEVSVAAVVSASLATHGIAGTVSPAAPGEPVELQRAKGSGWTTVTTTTTGPNGAFRFALPSAAASYRVRSAPGSGLAAGVSPPIQAPDEPG